MFTARATSNLSVSYPDDQMVSAQSRACVANNVPSVAMLVTLSKSASKDEIMSPGGVCLNRGPYDREEVIDMIYFSRLDHPDFRR